MHDAGVNGSGEEVVGNADCVDVSGEMKVELLHGYDLGISAACCTAFDSKGWAHGRLANAEDEVFADESEGLGESTTGGGFTFAQRCWGDGGDVDVFAVGPVFESIEDVQGDLGFSPAIWLEFVWGDASLFGDLLDGERFGCVRDFDVRRDFGTHDFLRER